MIINPSLLPSMVSWLVMVVKWLNLLVEPENAVEMLLKPRKSSLRNGNGLHVISIKSNRG